VVTFFGKMLVFGLKTAVKRPFDFALGRATLDFCAENGCLRGR